MADEKKLSVAEILAAARKMDGGAAGDEPAASEPAAEESSVESSAAGEAAVETSPDVAAKSGEESAAAAKLKSGERPSVAEMLAMARAETKPGASKDAGGESPAAAPKKPAAKKTAAKPAAKKPEAEKPAAPAERMDTASILAAARGDGKRGPVSKAEAPELLQRKTPVATVSKKPEAPEMPERPAYAVRPQAKVEAKVEERRSFVFLSALFGSSFATGMTLLGTTCVVWTLALARFMFPNVLTEPPSRFKVGFPDDFAPGQVETKFKAQFGIWLVSADYQGEPCIFALSTVCTHLGCTPNWLDSEQKFKCPCHGSGFYKDGINFEGPAPRPLERYAISVASDGQIEVDKSRKFQEEMGQWQDPASFVPV